MDVLAGSDSSTETLGNLFGDDPLQVGEGEDVHEGGLKAVIGTDVNRHHQLITEDAAPDTLEASWVVDAGILPWLPSCGLGPARMRRLYQRPDDVVELVDGLL